MHPRYDILAIDLDGTLLDPKGKVSEANRRAVASARAAGIRVIVCTGRGLIECRHILEEIGQEDPVVVAGGAIVACPTTGRTRHRFAVERGRVRDAVRTVLDHGHAALVLKDPLEAGYDYMVVRGTENHPLDPVTEWWFRSMNVRVRYVTSVDEDEHPEHTVRVGACGRRTRMAGVREALLRAGGEGAIVHHFPAVVAPDSAKRTPDGDVLDILELFDPRANKWSAIGVLAAEKGTPASRIAAIGDEINDLVMIQNAGLGIAMGNAVPSVAAAARRRTKGHDDDGVAHAIEQILAGAW